MRQVTRALAFLVLLTLAPTLAHAELWILRKGSSGGGSGVSDQSAAASKWFNSITSGVFGEAQPAFTDISGIATPAQLSATVNAQTGTTYTILTTDRGKLVTTTNGSAIAVTLPQAGGSFPSGFFFDIQNRGAGTATITPTTSTIDGAASLTLATAQGVRVFSDGTNDFTQRGRNSGAGSGTVESVAAPTQLMVVTDPTTTPVITLRPTNAIGNITGATTINWNNGLSQGATLTGNVTLTFSNPLDAGWHCLGLTQDGTGGRTVTWPGSVIWTGGVAPTVTPAAAGNWQGCFRWDGTSFWGIHDGTAVTAKLNNITDPDGNTVLSMGSNTINRTWGDVAGSGALDIRGDGNNASGTGVIDRVQTGTSSLRQPSEWCIQGQTNCVRVNASGILMAATGAAPTVRGGASHIDATRAGADFALTGTLTVPQLTANTDNWTPTQSSPALTWSATVGNVLRFSTDAARNITGLTFGAIGRVVILHNIGSFDATLKNDATSTAANRFLLGADCVVGANKSVALRYDDVSSRWRLFSSCPATSGGGSATVTFIEPGLRLTLTTAVPVTTSDVTGAGTLYYTPYKSGSVVYYTGSEWAQATISEINLSLTLTSGKNYDVFVSCSSSSACALSLSAAWTNDTTRADALGTQDGVTALNSDKTKLWVGTIRASGTNTTEDSAGGSTTQVGGKRFVWNRFNQVPRPLKVIDTTDSWNYSTGTWRQANNASGNKVEWVTGDASARVSAQAQAPIFSNNMAGRAAHLGVGIDSVTVPSGLLGQAYSATPSGVTSTAVGAYSGFPGLGYHYASWMEYGGDGTTTFKGDDGGVAQSGLIAELIH